MEFNKLVFAGLALGCLGAAAGGSYLATRHNQVSSLEAPVSRAPGAPRSGGTGHIGAGDGIRRRHQP